MLFGQISLEGNKRQSIFAIAMSSENYDFVEKLTQFKAKPPLAAQA
jgi:hypothetical protein